MAKKILIVDDERDFMGMVELLLKSAGYEVITAFDGIEGLEKARAEKPDLIILDVLLPKMEGNEICRLLKFDPNYKQIPVIILTARVQKEGQDLAAKAGADAYLEKPCEPSVLLDKIRELLGR